MFAQKEHVFTVSLQRRGPQSSWGLSIVGGADQGTSIVVTKVTPGSPCDKKLKEGDEIKKIDDYDARDITHENVHNLFQKARTTIKLVIKRYPSARKFGSIDDTFSSSFALKPQASFSNLSLYEQKSPKRSKTVTFAPTLTSLKCDFYDNAYTCVDDENEAEHVKNQPYRTTPLVLPGAKAKHEAPTGSYLRHHPNPTMRTGPPNYEYLPHDVAMKQKVADSIFSKMEKDEALAGKQIIRRPYNTPIGLYSDKNIVDTIHHTTGLNTGLSRSPSFGKQNPSMGPKKNFVYDPSKSETFKALQEEQFGDGPMHEVTVPAQPKVFTPMKQQRAYQPVQAHTYDPKSHSGAPINVHHHVPYVNSMGHSDEHIAQSGSFKRLMNMVLSDDY